MNKPWANLPNAHHIDWVLESVKQNPQLWSEHQRSVMIQESLAARTAAASAGARELAVKAGGAEVVYEAAVALANLLIPLIQADVDIVWNANAALIAYDDCDQYLNMSYEKLYVYAMISEKPQAILLLPMVYVREKLNDSALV